MGQRRMNQDAITTYAQDLSGWQDWQLSYRYGALYIFPSPDVAETINGLRAQYDPRSQAYCDAHISLTVPFPSPLTRLHWAQIKSLVTQGPFEIEYGPVHRWPGGSGVVLLVKPVALIGQLIHAIETADIFGDAVTRRPDFRPHMTIAEFVTAEKSAAIADRLRPGLSAGRFTCTRLSYAAPDERFHFSERAFLTLPAVENLSR